MAVIETIKLHLRDGVTAKEFVAANDVMVRDFLMTRPGYDELSRRIKVDAEGLWTIMLRWDSAAEANASMEAFMSSPATAAYLDAVDPSMMSMDQQVEVPLITPRPAAHVHALYLDGIGGGNIHEALDAHLGDHYTQHSTGVRDGRDGFLEFFEPFLEAHPQREIELVRTLTDGRYVFVHANQVLDGGAARWVTADIFLVDGNDKIVEHWDVITATREPNPSGRTQVDGATEIDDLELTEKNKDVVRRLLTEGLSKSPTADVGDFISAEQYLQHNSGAPDGLDALRHLLESGGADGSADVLRSRPPDRRPGQLRGDVVAPGVGRERHGRHGHLPPGGRADRRALGRHGAPAVGRQPGQRREVLTPPRGSLAGPDRRSAAVPATTRTTTA